MSALNPAIYYPWVYLKGGAERVILELVQRSRHHWTVYTNHFDAAATFPDLGGIDMVQLPQVSVRRGIPQVAHAGFTLLTQKLDLEAHDSLFVVSEGLGNLVATRSRIPTSCICLTPLKVVYDSVTRGRFFDGRRRPAFRAAFALYEQFDRPAWRRYVRVFANSGEVRRRLLENDLVESDRIEVAYHGVDLDRYQPAGGREPVFLVPGRIMWQKNLELTIDAWRLFKPDPASSAFRLVIAGMVDAKSRPYLAALRERAGDRQDIEFVVSPADDRLIELYQQAWAILFAPRNEDWGLVPLEAMACGKPVIATDRGGPRESVVDGVTGMLRPDRPEDFARAIAELAANGEAEMDALALRARARALEFPWSRFVHRIDEHVEELAALSSRKPVAAPAAVLSGTG